MRRASCAETDYTYKYFRRQHMLIYEHLSIRISARHLTAILKYANFLPPIILAVAWLLPLQRCRICGAAGQNDGIKSETFLRGEAVMRKVG